MPNNTSSDIMINHNKSKKILLLYALIFLAFIIFLSVMLLTVLKSRNMPSLYAIETSKASRGAIISADNFHLATTKKLYKAVVDTRYIDPQKKELFIKLFHIYSNISVNKIRKRLSTRRGTVVLSYNIEEIQSHYLKKLAYELRRFKVFLSLQSKTTGLLSIHGLNIIESGESREYPYGNLLTPILGYTRKVEKNDFTFVKGVEGLERRWNNELSGHQNGYIRGKRDVNNYIILNKESFTKPKINGLNIKLTIPVAFQIRIEKMLSKMKIKLRAKEVMLAVMNSKTGRVLAMASSNRYFPKAIKRSNYSSLNCNMIDYSYEPGSVLKPITFSLLLEHKLVNPYELVNGHNGRYKIEGRVITDDYRFHWISAENVIVYSSNIGMAQLSQRLSGYQFHNGLKKFGFGKKSTPDLIYEHTGYVPTQRRLNNEIYKATCSYGYGIRVNLMQLMRAYDVFNNHGVMVYPRIVDAFIDDRGHEKKLEQLDTVQVIPSAVAQRMKKILIKTVNKGTGRKTIIKGLQIGGKTGTAHIVEKGKYVNKYDTTFMGFVNDKKHHYTMGVVVIQPQKSQYAAETAVPVFRKAAEIMIENGYLKPNIIE